MPQITVVPGAIAAAGAPVIDVSAAVAAVPAKGAIKSFLDRLTGSYNALDLAIIKDSWWTLNRAGLLASAQSDVLCFPMKNQADSLLNWVGPLAPQASLNGGVAWSAGVFSLDGTSGYISTGVTPNTGTPAWGLNSAHIGLDIRAMLQEDPAGSGNGNIPLAQSILGIGTSSGGALYYIPFNGSATPAGSTGIRVNSSSTTQVTMGSSISRVVDTVLNRIDASNVETILEGALRATTAQASAAVPTGVIQIGRNGSAYSKLSLSGFTVGKALTTAQKAARLRVIQNMRRQFAGG